MNFETRASITLEEYVEMIGLKTAVLIACSAKLGAIIAGADDKTAEALYNYGFQLGLAFQIKDDYLDSFGNTLTFGKAIGGDILSNKKTWLLVEAFKRADTILKEELHSIMSSTDINPKNKIKEVLSIYDRLGVKNSAEQAVAEYHKKALVALIDTTLTEKQKNQLFSFGEALINRDR